MEKMKGNLTLSKAIGTLFNLSDSEDLTLLRALEQKLKRSGWSNAYAIGINTLGALNWASVIRFPSIAHARDATMENCGAGDSKKCRVVFVNGEFLENEFIELAGNFRNYDFESAHRSYLDSLRNPPRESLVFNTDADSRHRIPNVFNSAPPVAINSSEARSPR